MDTPPPMTYLGLFSIVYTLETFSWEGSCPLYIHSKPSLGRALVHCIYTQNLLLGGLFSIVYTLETFSWEGFVFCMLFMDDLKSCLFTTSCILRSALRLICLYSTARNI